MTAAVVSDAGEITLPTLRAAGDTCRAADGVSVHTARERGNAAGVVEPETHLTRLCQQSGGVDKRHRQFHKITGSRQRNGAGRKERVFLDVSGARGGNTEFEIICANGGRGTPTF